MTNEDSKAWFACYTAALTGVLAAHAGSGALPDAPTIAKMAVSMTDAAIEQARQRWPNKPLDPFIGIYGGR